MMGVINARSISVNGSRDAGTAAVNHEIALFTATKASETTLVAVRIWRVSHPKIYPPQTVYGTEETDFQTSAPADGA